MNWIDLTSSAQIDTLFQEKQSALIFKHSSRCFISDKVKSRFEKEVDEYNLKIPIYFLDILNFRALSNEIAERFQEHHESPQLLIIQHGECVFAPSHSDIVNEESWAEMQKL